MPSPSSIDLTNFDLVPAARSVRSVTEDARRAATGIVKEAAYTGIGLAVLSYQRLQVRRREFERSLRVD